MKKKLLALLLTGVMAATMLTACGGSSEEASTETATEATEDTSTEESADDSEEAADGMVSDETFAELQENYAAVSEAYDAVTEYYMSDEVEADADVEDVLNSAADVMAQMGEITQDTITEEDAETLNSAMLDIVNALSILVDGMETTDTAEEASGEMVSDETFAALQESYNAMVEGYNIVYDYYMSDGVEADADIEALLEEAASIIEQMGEITQDSITEDDAVSLNDSMVTIMEALSVIIDAM